MEKRLKTLLVKLTWEKGGNRRKEDRKGENKEQGPAWLVGVCFQAGPNRTGAAGRRGYPSKKGPSSLNRYGG